MNISYKKVGGFAAVFALSGLVLAMITRSSEFREEAGDQSAVTLGGEQQGDGEGSGPEETTTTTERPIEIIPADPGLPPIFRAYGNPQIAVSLADTEAGGRTITAVAHTVRFPRDGTLEAVRPFLVYVPGQAGDDSFYHKGDGSTMEFRLESDDGTPEHNPTGEVLARTGNVIGGPEIYDGSGPEDATVGGDPGDDANFRKLAFVQPVEVKANTWYHLVMYNTGNDPRNNFVSFDDYFSGGEDRDPQVPLFEDLDFAVRYQSGGTWQNRETHWAIGDFYFSDGFAFGNGYMEVGSVNGPDRVANFVNAEQSIRQRFIPPQDLGVNGVHIGAMHVDGPNTLLVSLRDGEDNELWSGEVGDFPTGAPSGSPRGNASVFTAEFRGDDSVPAVELRAGDEYFLVVESTGGTHTVTATRDGSKSYNFSERTTVFGQAELNAGSGWIGWQLGDTASIVDEFDISFYLKTVNCVGCS